MSGLTINVGVRGLGEFSSRITRERQHRAAKLKAFMESELRGSLPKLRQATKKHTGRTADAWRLRPGTDREMALTNNSPLISMQFTGTRPHNIPGAFGFRLPFGTHGRFSGMFHPGTKQNTVLVAAMDSESRRIRQDFAAFGARLAITYERATLPGGDTP